MSEKYRPRVSKVSAKCQWNIGHLSTEYRLTCVSVERHAMSVNMSTECWSTYRPSIGRCIDWHSVDMLTDSVSRYWANRCFKYTRSTKTWFQQWSSVLSCLFSKIYAGYPTLRTAWFNISCHVGSSILCSLDVETSLCSAMASIFLAAWWALHARSYFKAAFCVSICD